jgi:hypothetical protein
MQFGYLLLQPSQKLFVDTATAAEIIEQELLIKTTPKNGLDHQHQHCHPLLLLRFAARTIDLDTIMTAFLVENILLLHQFYLIKMR